MFLNDTLIFFHSLYFHSLGNINYMYVEFPLPFTAIIFPLIFNYFHSRFIFKCFLSVLLSVNLNFSQEPCVFNFWNCLFFFLLISFLFLEALTNFVVLLCLLWSFIILFWSPIYTCICFTKCFVSIPYIWLHFHLFNGSVSMNIFCLSFIFHAPFLYFSVIYSYKSHAESHIIFTHLSMSWIFSRSGSST